MSFKAKNLHLPPEESLRIILFQMKPKLGDLYYNADKIISFYEDHNDSDIIITPELAISGYSPLDNLLSNDFKESLEKQIQRIIDHTKNKKSTLILGSPWYEENSLYNVALVIENGHCIKVVYKSILPNYGVFNENRYFKPNPQTENTINLKNKKIAIFVCEDLWHQEKIESVHQKENKIDLAISINASPFELSRDFNKNKERLKVSQYATKKLDCPLIYLNTVGGVDDIIFDGSSFILNQKGNNLGYLNHAREDILSIELLNADILIKERSLVSNQPSSNQLIYETIMLGLQDFLDASSFDGVIIGISGGIDSTITATMATDCLGAENVFGISMPSKYTSKLSKEIIEDIKAKLGIKIIEVPIDDLVEVYKKSLGILNLEKNNVLDNIQARIRGQILMAFANQHSKFMVLTTGNKSEISTGYSTLYGDTCGGYNLLKDLYKTQVFELCKWRNINIPNYSKLKKENVIPDEAINRKPSAELQDNQFDEDSLMDYNILDNILYDSIENNLSLNKLYQKYDKHHVNKTLNLLKNSHYKRIQSALGVNISPKAFGKNYQYNISDKYNKLNY